MESTYPRDQTLVETQHTTTAVAGQYRHKRGGRRGRAHPQILEMAEGNPSPRLAAMVVLTTSSGCFVLALLSCHSTDLHTPDPV